MTTTNLHIPSELREDQGSFLSGGEPLVFHCHHYNIALQQAIEECLPEGYARLLTDAATEVVTPQVAAVLGSNPSIGSFAERLAVAAEISRKLGFGLIKLEGDLQGGTAIMPRSHYAYGWRSKYSRRDVPTCWFHTGFAAAAFAAAAGLPAGSFVAEETDCAAVRSDECVFRVRRCDPPRPLPISVGEGQTPKVAAPPLGPTANINSQAIIDAVRKLPIEGNEEGLIPVFGVYLTRHYANYYNRVSYEFERLIGEQHPSLVEPVRLALIEAGHRCAFNTFGGIAQSVEWEALIEPMCRDKSDWFHGIIACVNAFGWGAWRTTELVPSERAVVEVFGSYESNGRLAMYGKADRGSCFLHMGGVAGLMNLLWVGDLTKRPTLDAAYYTQIYSQPESFSCDETTCRSRGDDRCTFVATRKRF